jgi:outer membrane protein insertion porin family
VDVKVRATSDRTELQVGAGWSETYGFFGQLSVRTQNFLGRGETVGLSFQSGRYQDEYGLSYYIPWWLDRPQSIGLQLFKSNLNYSQTTIQQSERQSQGAVLTYGRNFGLFGSGSISYTLSQSKDRLFYSGPANAIVELNYDIANSSIQPTYSFDSRDSRLETTRGWNLVGSVEYAGGFLGGDNYFWRPEVHLSRFQPLTFSPVKTLAAFNLEAGIVKPFDGREVVPLERYFMGGENSVRGFQFRSIFVRDEKTNLPVLQDGYYKGGNKFLQMNVELQVLVGGPFRVILFADGGNVYDDDQSIDVSRLRYSAGGELRIFVPIFGAPLRFIYSSNLDPIKPNPPLEPGDRFESFQFSIGATF